MTLTRGRMALGIAVVLFVVAIVVGFPQLNQQVVHEGWGCGRAFTVAIRGVAPRNGGEPGAPGMASGEAKGCRDDAVAYAVSGGAPIAAAAVLLLVTYRRRLRCEAAAASRTRGLG